MMARKCHFQLKGTGNIIPKQNKAWVCRLVYVGNRVVIFMEAYMSSRMLINGIDWAKLLGTARLFAHCCVLCQEGLRLTISDKKNINSQSILQRSGVEWVHRKTTHQYGLLSWWWYTFYLQFAWCKIQKQLETFSIAGHIRFHLYWRIRCWKP